MSDSILLLYSGGLDSTTLLYKGLRQWGRMTVLLVDYGQENRELERARILASEVPFGEAVIKETYVGFPDVFRSEALLGGDRFHCRTLEEIRQARSPMFVPGRNMVFLSLAAGLATKIGADAIWFGANADDTTFPDCKQDFVDAMSAASQAQGGPRVEAPLLDRQKWEVVQMAEELQVPLDRTVSCYEYFHGEHCGRCDACIIRSDAFERADVRDTTPYRSLVT